MTPEQYINEQIKMKGVDTNIISDGYHTFGELYDHRITLFIVYLELLSRQMDSSQCEYTYKDDIWKSKKHSDGTEWEGWFILGINKNHGEQVTYHLPIDKWKECDFAKTLETAPEWDGHTSADVLERLKNL